MFIATMINYIGGHVIAQAPENHPRRRIAFVHIRSDESQFAGFFLSTLCFSSIT